MLTDQELVCSVSVVAFNVHADILKTGVQQIQTCRLTGLQTFVIFRQVCEVCGLHFGHTTLKTVTTLSSPCLSVAGYVCSFSLQQQCKMLVT